MDVQKRRGACAVQATCRAFDGEPVGGMIQRDHTFDKNAGSRWLGMISVPDVKAARGATWRVTVARWLFRRGF